MLHVGTSHSLFYDFTGHIKDRYDYILVDNLDDMWSNSKALEKERAEQLTAYGDLGTTSGSYFYRSVMYDHGTGKSKVVVPDIWVPTQPYYTYSLAHIYEEDVPELEWEITGEHGTVASFDCQKAECDFRGRRWEAWFTTEIPFSEGPWKLRGLPGLILYARDTTGQYSFEAVSVTDEPVPFYDYIYENEKKTTYRKFKRYERSCFRWPKSFKENTSVFIVTGNGIEEADYQNWRMPYYPMEWQHKSSNKPNRQKHRDVPYTPLYAVQHISTTPGGATTLRQDIPSRQQRIPPMPPSLARSADKTCEASCPQSPYAPRYNPPRKACLSEC